MIQLRQTKEIKPEKGATDKDEKFFRLMKGFILKLRVTKNVNEQKTVTENEFFRMESLRLS